MVLGRGKHVEIVVDSNACSREHVSFEVIDGVLHVADLGSSNGTWLNGKRVARPTALVVGDVMHAGRPKVTLVAFAALGDVSV